MKKIEAVIRPFKFDEVRTALLRVGVTRMTVSLITVAGRTGRPGAGTIFASPIEDAIRIRTGDRGEDILWD